MRLVTSTLNQSARMLTQRIRSGDMVVDATAGGGNDTLFLARLVGGHGKVHAFDMQQEALERTRERLAEHGVLDRASLHLADHGDMEEVLKEARGMVRAVMFNLGFLPGSDSPVVTQPDSTLKGLSASLGILAPDGVLSVVCYEGHEGGEQETQAVEGWMRALDFERYRVLRFEVCNKPGSPIILFFVESVARTL